LTFDDQLEQALATFSGLLREEVARQVRVAGDELAATARAEAALRADGSAAARLLDGIRAFDGARSLTDVLATLMRCAGQEASRVAVLLVRGNHFTIWRTEGFGTSVDTADPTEIAGADAGVIAQAVRTASVASSDGDDRAVSPAFAQLPAGRDCVALPLALYGEVVAVLYADVSPSNPEPGTLNLEPLEVLCRHAARCLEALTAIKAARSLTVKPEVQPASSASPGDDLNDEHASARRSARILVSEIKLYHEADVVAGRRERDLTTRLGGEIARARALYEQRVPSDVRHTSDYVREELIRTLADGDATLLEAI
jgi:hypothetical protein